MLRRTNGQGKSVNGLLFIDTMCVVDLGDQLIGQEEPQFRSLKLWKKILFGFLMMASGKFMNAIFQTFEFIFVNTYNCLPVHHMKSAL